MADAEFSFPPHPLANPGYGKRSTGYELPRAATDFGHLPPREAAIAAYIDRVPEGSDISVKTLAKQLPYGQCALRTALNRIQRAGHLRRGRECLGGRWITRTWFTRTPRDVTWWAAFRRGDVPREPRRPTRSRAYVLLAALGRTNSAMSLSHAECHALAPLVEEWFARDAEESDVLRALTAGLPASVHYPAGMARRRLTDKLPPEPIRSDRISRRMLECAECGAPDYTDSLVDGQCAPCRGTPSAPTSGDLPAADIHGRVDAIRQEMKGTRT